MNPVIRVEKVEVYGSAASSHSGAANDAGGEEASGTDYIMQLLEQPIFENGLASTEQETSAISGVLSSFLESGSSGSSAGDRMRDWLMGLSAQEKNFQFRVGSTLLRAWRDAVTEKLKSLKSSEDSKAEEAKTDSATDKGMS